MDQLWRADITYLRLREEFVFLAVILDAYSRRVIAWAWRSRVRSSNPAWSITPIAAPSMPATITRIY